MPALNSVPAIIRRRRGALSEIEAPSCRSAGAIPWRTRFANVRPHAIDRAGGRDADVTYKGRAAIALASHTPVFVIDIRAGDSIEIGVVFQ